MRLALSLKNWEEAIRSGQGTSVAKSILALRPADIPKERRSEVANLARRVGLYKYALVLLRTDFLSARENLLAHEPLVTEYAATLTEVGASRLSERLFTSFTKPSYEMTYFYRALLWMKIWRYDRVPQELEAFKKVCSDPYRLHIADVNLVSALIVLKRYNEAQNLLDSLQKQTDLPLMAKGVIAEQMGQLLFFTDRRKEARKYFENSYAALKQTKNPSALYAEKWINIIDLFEKPWASFEKPWLEFRKRAKETGFWEVLRELDRFHAVRFNEDETIKKLYFGTPLDGYRELLCRDLNWTPPSEFVYSPIVANPKVIFDTSELRLKRDGTTVKMPPTLARLMMGLSQDLYKPAATGSLFESVYPDDYYHPAFGADRVRKALARLRQFTEENKIPIEILSSTYGFHLPEKPKFGILYSTTASSGVSADDRAHLASVIEKKFGQSEFTTADLVEATGISKRTLNRKLSEEIESGNIISHGRGRKIRYRLPPVSAK